MMAYRGRGRGRGRGRFGGVGGGFLLARQEPFVLFPLDGERQKINWDINFEVDLPDTKDVKEEKALVVWNSRLTNYFKTSPYYIEEMVAKESQSMDIERFSDKGKAKITSERDSLDQFLQLTSKHFPKELIGGLKRKQPNKNVQWKADSDLQKLDIFEKLESKLQGQAEKEKKDGDEEDEDEGPEEPDDEDDDDGDYNQNIDFDDDEDDYNMDDDNDDEAIY